MDAFPQHAILGPVFAMIGLTFVVWLVMYVRRISFLQRAGIAPNELTPARLAEASPPHVANPSDNLKNLFEIPVLFYALALLLVTIGRVDALYLGAAWAFVAFRVAHSAVHCTVNIVMLRFALYLLSTACVWFIAARAAYQHLAT